MTGQDRYLNAGNAEFLIFFAGVTPEESRIRCLAIVEQINDRLFGLEGTKRKVAECHLIHRDDLASEWGAANAAKCAQHCEAPTAQALQKSFRRGPEVLEAADVAASTQVILDSIINGGAASHNLAELTPLLV